MKIDFKKYGCILFYKKKNYINSFFKNSSFLDMNGSYPKRPAALAQLIANLHLLLLH